MIHQTIAAGFFVPGFWNSAEMCSMTFEAFTDVIYIGVDLNAGLEWYMEPVLPWWRFVVEQSATAGGGK